MSNTRESIFDDLKSGLEGITTSGGYLSDVKGVVRSPEFMKFTKGAGGTPFLNIVDQRDVFITDVDDTYGLAMVEAIVEGLVKSGKDLEEKVNKLISDLKKFLNSFTSSSVRKSFYTDIDINYSRAEAYFHMRVFLKYSYTRSDP